MAWGDLFGQQPPAGAAPAASGPDVSRFKQQPPGVIEDVARSGAAGLRRGIESIPGTPQDILNLAAIGAAYVSGKMGASPQTQEAVRGSLDVPYLPSSEDIHQATSKVVGESYEPQTTAGRYAETAGEFAPAFISPTQGLAKAGTKAALGIGAGLASEAAGQATAGSRFEPIARMLTGLAAGAAPEAATAGRQFIKAAPGREAEIAAEEAAKRGAPGVRLTKGQRTGDVEQQIAEQQMLKGARSGFAQRLMEARQRENLEAVKDASGGIMDVTAPTRGTTPVEAGGLLNQQTAARAERLASEGGAKIQKALEGGVMLDADVLRGLPSELQTKLSGNVPFVPDVILDATTPIASQAMQRVETFVKAAKDPNVKEISMAGAEQLRRQLGKLKATDPTDRRALSKIQAYFDDWYDNAIDTKARVTGAPNALPGTRDPRDVLTELKAGRATSKESFDITRPRNKPPGGREVSKIATEGALPENTARLLRPNDAGQLSTQAIETIDRLKKTGATDADLDQVRGIILDQLMTGDPGKVATRIDNFTHNNPTAASQLFKPDEIQTIKDWASTNRQLVPKREAINPSQSSYGIVRELKKQGTRAAASQGGIVGSILGGPVGAGLGMAAGSATEVLSQLKSAREAKKALAGADRSTLTETIVKGGRTGAARATPGAVQGAQSLTINDPDDPNYGDKVKIISEGQSGYKVRLPNGQEKIIGKGLVK
jgi:hypothetical protein